MSKQGPDYLKKFPFLDTLKLSSEVPDMLDLVKPFHDKIINGKTDAEKVEAAKSLTSYYNGSYKITDLNLSPEVEDKIATLIKKYTELPKDDKNNVITSGWDALYSPQFKEWENYITKVIEPISLNFKTVSDELNKLNDDLDQEEIAAEKDITVLTPEIEKIKDELSKTTEKTEVTRLQVQLSGKEQKLKHVNDNLANKTQELMTKLNEVEFQKHLIKVAAVRSYNQLHQLNTLKDAIPTPDSFQKEEATLKQKENALSDVCNDEIQTALLDYKTKEEAKVVARFKAAEEAKAAEEIKEKADTKANDINEKKEELKDNIKEVAENIKEAAKDVKEKMGDSINSMLGDKVDLTTGLPENKTPLIFSDAQKVTLHPAKNNQQSSESKAENSIEVKKANDSRPQDLMSLCRDWSSKPAGRTELTVAIVNAYNDKYGSYPDNNQKLGLLRRDAKIDRSLHREFMSYIQQAISNLTQPKAPIRPTK